MTFVTILLFMVSLHTHRTVPLNYSYMLNLVLTQDSSLLCYHYRIEERGVDIKRIIIIHFSTNMLALAPHILCMTWYQLPPPTVTINWATYNTEAHEHSFTLQSNSSLTIYIIWQQFNTSPSYSQLSSNNIWLHCYSNTFSPLVVIIRKISLS